MHLLRWGKSPASGVKALTLAGLMLAGAAGYPQEVRAQDKSQDLALSVPSSAAAGSRVAITATLSDSWNGRRLAGRLVAFGVGQEFYLANAGSYNTSNSGVTSFTWRFANRGRYRVVAYVDNGYGYLSQRSARFIDIR